MLLLAVLLLGGCPTGVFIQHDPQSEAVADLEPGVHTRADVIALLGEPLVSLPERGVDVFQREGELTDVLLPGVPYTTEWTFHTLISYDEQGDLTGIDTGGRVYRNRLNVGRFSYWMGQPGMLVEQEITPAYLEPAPGCSIVLLVVGNRWSDKLYYQDPIRLDDLVLQGPPDYASYYLLSVAPGGHLLRVTWNAGMTTEERSFGCADRETVFVTLNADHEGSTIDVAHEVPPELPGRALILFPLLTEAPVTGR
ncbi:MAG TPA: hypothetical protein VIS76_05875 [Pseudomonadales bacterium]